MSDDTKRPNGPSFVNTKGLKELKLLQAKLMGHDAQLRNFTPLRDRLVASGQDANATYRQIESQRDQVMAELKKLAPAATRPPVVPGSVRRPLPGASVLSMPIAPLKFLPPFGPWFGYSGTVQMGQGGEGVTVVPQGQYPSTGSIYTVELTDTGFIEFDGRLQVGPAELPSGQQYTSSLDYFWLHNWNYFMVFPAPVVTSTFTYSFDVFVQADIFLNGGFVTFMSFVSMGETPNFTNQDVPVNTDGGWPLVADLTQPYSANGSLYGGHYGYVQGQLTVQRSFVVEGGQTPAVALVLGVVSAQSMGSDVSYYFPGLEGSFISAGSTNGVGGLVNFHYQPQPLVARQ